MVEVTPFYSAPDGQTIYVGDVRDVLRQLPDESVQMVITSPPYWALRSYGIGVENGEIGLERTPAEYVATMVEVFREVRRVLRSDGTCWLNIGDSFASGKGTCYNPGGGDNSLGQERKGAGVHPLDRGSVTSLRANGLKPKDLIGIPWRVALALQADGWYLRSDVIWHKLSCMPESVTDRPTSAHEHIFLLAKRPTYYYDSMAVRQPAAESTEDRAYLGVRPIGPGQQALVDQGFHGETNSLRDYGRTGSNLRNVLSLGPEPLREQHYAAFPTAIPRIAILAGTSEAGACPRCGKPWVRVTERSAAPPDGHQRGDEALDTPDSPMGRNGHHNDGLLRHADFYSKSLGFRPACSCDAGPAVPCVILDPFLGSGTSLLVARQLGRRGIGIELNPKYAELAIDRLEAQTPSLFGMEV